MKEQTSQIDSLKNQLEIARTTTERWENLTIQREELETMIEKLGAEIHGEKRNLHRSHSEKLLTSIEKMEGLFIDLNKRKGELDHLLDRIEGHTRDHITTIRTSLIEEILRLHPTEKSTYDSLVNQKNEWYLQSNELNEVYHSLHQIHALLEVILDERSSVKRRGILRYILGKSPNFIITKCLDTARELSTDAIETMNRYPQSEEYKKVHTLLESFLTHCSEKWSFKKIDTVFAETSNQLTTHLENIQAKQELVESETERAEEQLEAWISKW